MEKDIKLCKLNNIAFLGESVNINNIVSDDNNAMENIVRPNTLLII